MTAQLSRAMQGVFCAWSSICRLLARVRRALCEAWPCPDNPRRLEFAADKARKARKARAANPTASRHLLALSLGPQVKET